MSIFPRLRRENAHSPAGAVDQTRMTSSRVRSFAFYNPAFQPTAETDVALGRGWTEWTQVAEAKPLYVGHQQPRLPRDLGFYDLRFNLSVQAQADLAKQYGIDGFIYGHYWFDGRRIYDTALPEDFSFATCWKNADFCTPEGEVIVAQTYSEADDRAHARYITAYMSDARWIRIDGKPLFIIEDVTALPNPQQTAQIWRDEARQAGVGEIFLAYCEDFASTVSPQQLGFDAAIENAPLRSQSAATFYETLETHNYLDAASLQLATPDAGYRRFSTVTPGYDSTPVSGMSGCVFLDSNPDLYKGWVASTIQRDVERSITADVVMFVNSWNDWAAGSNLEPSNVWGTRYLEAHHQGLQQGAGFTPSTTIEVPEITLPTAVVTEPTTNRVGVSVVMVANGDAQATMRTLQSALETCTDVGRVEFVVVDNGTHDETAELLQALQNEVFSVRNHAALPSLQAWSQALSYTNGDYVVFVSNDVVLQPNWLQAPILTLATDPQCAAVTPRININGQLATSQPLSMTTGVCLVSRSAALNNTLPTDALAVDGSTVALATSVVPA